MGLPYSATLYVLALFGGSLLLAGFGFLFFLLSPLFEGGIVKPCTYYQKYHLASIKVLLVVEWKVISTLDLRVLISVVLFHH